MHNSKILYEKGLLHNKMMLTQSQLSQIKFNAQLASVNLFYSALKTISFNEDCVLQITDEGLKIIVEESRHIQACCYITRNYFESFHAAKDLCMTFGSKLNIIADCLSLFSMGTEAKLRMIYKGEGAPFILVLEHGSDDEEIVTECSIKTQNFDECLDFNIDDDTAVNTIVMNSPELAYILNDIDKTDGDLQITISPTEPHLQISTVRNLSSEIVIEISQPNDMILSFTSKVRTENRYKSDQIAYFMKSLALGQTVSFRTNKEGLLGIQILASIGDDKQICIEYYMVPLIDDSDDEVTLM